MKNQTLVSIYLIIPFLTIFFYTAVNAQIETKIIAGDGVEFDYFGHSLSISDNYILVGAPGDDDNGSYSGSAYVCRCDGIGWIKEAKLLPSDGAEGDWFGGSVSINKDIIVVGACTDDDNGYNSGAVYIFKRNGTTYNEEVKLIASDGEDGDCFGFSVSINVDTAIVGADRDGLRAGWAYIFFRN